MKKFSSPNKLIFVIIGICVIVGIGGVSGYLYFTDQQKQLQNKLDEIQKQKQQVESQKQQEEIAAQKTQQQLQDQANQKQLELQQQQQQAAQQAAQQQAQLQQQQQQAAQQAAQQQAILQQQQQQAAQQAADAAQQLQQQQQHAAQQAAQQQAILQQQQQQAALQQQKNGYIDQSHFNAVVAGLIKGYLNVYIAPLPDYAGSDVQNAVNNIVSALDGKTIVGIPVHVVYDETQSDIRIQWVKDFGYNPLGETVFGKQIIVGLGSSNCGGTWQPFDGYSVEKIMWHELGHSFGYNHSTDPNNVMYPTTSTKYVQDKNDNYLFTNGVYRSYPFCQGGTNFFQISNDNQNIGFNTYVVPPNTNAIDVINGKAPYYLSCSKNNMISYASTCSVEYGSYLLVYNPSNVLGGNNQNIHVMIRNVNPPATPNMAWDPNAWSMTQQQFTDIWNLFHNS